MNCQFESEPVVKIYIISWTGGENKTDFHCRKCRVFIAGSIHDPTVQIDTPTISTEKFIACLCYVIWKQTLYKIIGLIESYDFIFHIFI